MLKNSYSLTEPGEKFPLDSTERYGGLSGSPPKDTRAAQMSDLSSGRPVVSKYMEAANQEREALSWSQEAFGSRANSAASGTVPHADMTRYGAATGALGMPGGTLCKVCDPLTSKRYI